MTVSSLPDYMQRADTEPFEGDEDRLLIEQAHLVSELVKQPGWEVLAGQIRAQVASWERKVMNGGCKDHDDYLISTNYARGLRHLLEAPEALDRAAVAARERLNRP